MLKLCILGMSIALIGGVGVVSMSATHEQSENVVNINRENKKLVSYDDENHVITLTANELNNYTWDNFNDYVCANFSSLFSVSNAIDGIEYHSTSYYFAEDTYLNDANNVYIAFSNNGYLIEFNFDDGVEPLNIFHYYSPNETDYLPFEYDVYFTCYAEYYNDLKSAIELDIQANMDSSNVMPSIADLFQQVTAAVNAFIGSLGDAFTQVTSLFWVTTGDNQGPTFLGMLILIGVGVGLVYFVYRVIKGLVHRI